MSDKELDNDPDYQEIQNDQDQKWWHQQDQELQQQAEENE